MTKHILIFFTTLLLSISLSSLGQPLDANPSCIIKSDTISGIPGKTTINIDKDSLITDFIFQTKYERISVTQINRFVTEFRIKYQVWKDFDRPNGTDYRLKYYNDGVEYFIRIDINDTLRLKKIKFSIEYIDLDKRPRVMN